MDRSRRWDELSAPKKALVMLLTSVQVSLAVSAWSDLAERPPETVNGSKKTWAAIIAVNFVGPILYYWRGRRAAPPDGLHERTGSQSRGRSKPNSGAASA
jgi:hypothetical protein